MRSKIIYTLIFITLFISFNSNSQNEDLNLKKYWYYHYRLVNDFMAKGDCQGCSEVMSQRAYQSKTGHTAKWGDQTIELGEYIGALAMEYKLLHDNDQPTDTTIKELYYAIKAFNRLDEEAEGYDAIMHGTTHTNSASDLNGFFIRDDVPEDFLDFHPKLAQGTTSDKTVSYVDSDYKDALPGPVGGHLILMSHDQVWQLFMGFALISKFIPDLAVYQPTNPLPPYNLEPPLFLNDYDNNPYIRQEVINIVSRIINRMQGDSWLIKDPITEGTVFGGIVTDLAYGAAEAACFIQDPSFDSPISCPEYSDPITVLDVPIWGDLDDGLTGAALSLSTEDYKVQTLAAIGNSWYDGYTETNITEVNLGLRESVFQNWHMSLLRQILHGGGNPIDNNTYTDMLNSAPCVGPFCFHKYSDGDCATFDWSSSDRLHESDQRSPSELYGWSKSSDDGEYPGVDYMLYYSLYHKAEPSTDVPFVNLMDRLVTITIPTSTGFGSGAHPESIDAFDDIIANDGNDINSDAVVDYHAGNEIDLQPGFHASAGADFHAYVRPFKCAADGDYRHVTTTDPQTNNPIITNMVAYNGPTTFVNYPAVSDHTGLSYAGQTNNFAQTNKKSVAASTVASISEISIAPNPNNGEFKANISSGNIHQIILYDVLGKEVQKFTADKASVDMDISAYPKGVYFVRIEADNITEMKKVIFQ